MENLGLAAPRRATLCEKISAPASCPASVNPYLTSAIGKCTLESVVSANHAVEISPRSLVGDILGMHESLELIFQNSDDIYFHFKDSAELLSHHFCSTS